MKNGKVYIGQSAYDLHTRAIRHRYASQTGSKLRFHQAIRKHGFEAFKWQVLFEHSDRALVLKKEEAFIIEYQSMKFELGYNSCAGGTGGFVVPEEKYDEWLTKITARSQGKRNARYNGFSDEELLSEAIKVCLKLGYVPPFQVFRDHSDKWPKSLSKFRFGGRGYLWILNELCRLTGLPRQRRKWSEESKRLQSGTITITNGVVTKRIRPDEAIPDGFRRGRAPHKQRLLTGKRCITNGSKNRFIGSDEPIPDGFRIGSFSRANKTVRGRIWINNEAIELYLNKDADIPEGFKAGRISRRKSNA